MGMMIGSQLVSGLVTAAVLFLMAAGLSLIFGVCRVLNLAQGSFYMSAAFLAYGFTELQADSPFQFWLALLVVPVITAGVGMLFEVTVLRRFYGQNLLLQLMPTVAIMFIIPDLLRMVWGPMPKSVSLLGQFGTLAILGIQFPAYYAIVVFAGVVIGAGLWCLIYHTRWGILIRATAQDREMSGVCGVNEAPLFTAVFGLALWLVGVAGVLVVPTSGAALGMDVESLVSAFAVVVVGGLGSVAGSMLSAALIGLVQAFGILVVPQYALAFVYALMAVVLIIRPRGLLGSE